MLTVRVEGAVPLAADSVSHLPPSAVLPEAVQCSVPVSAVPDRDGLRCRVLGGGAEETHFTRQTVEDVVSGAVNG